MQRKNHKLVLNSAGRYELRWSEKPEGADRWYTRRISTGTGSLAEAETFRDSWVRDEARVERVEKSLRRATVGAIMDDYWRDHLEPRLTRNGKPVPTAARSQFRRARDWFDDMLPGDVTAGVVRDYKKSRPVSESTTKKELGHVKAALGWAVKHGELLLADKPYIDAGQDGRARELYLDEEQERAFWEEAVGAGAGGPCVGLFVAIGLDTAARYEAIMELTWDRVDLDRGVIDFRVPGHVYTKKRRGVVPISDRLAPVLKSVKRGRTSGRVFDVDVRGRFEKWVRGSSWPWVTPHVMRHTWATLAARNGVSLEEIALVLADTIATTEKHYRHHQPGWLMGAVNRRFRT